MAAPSPWPTARPCRWTRCGRSSSVLRALRRLSGGDVRPGGSGGALVLTAAERPALPLVGVVLAGGAGRRLIGSPDGPAVSSKAAVPLAGRALVSYPLSALGEVCDHLAVVCKPDTVLPPIGEAERWDEPEEPRHPLTGIVSALERAGGPVLVCAADMPFVTSAACWAVVSAAWGGDGLVGAGAPTGDRTPTPRRGGMAAADALGPGAWGGPMTAVATTAAGLEPLLGLYSPGALAPLRSAPAGAPLRRTVAALEPIGVPLPAPLLRSVNSPGDLAAAEAELARRRAGDREGARSPAPRRRPGSRR